MLDAPDNATGYADGMGARALRANTVAVGEPGADEPLQNRGVHGQARGVSCHARPRSRTGADGLHGPAYLRTELKLGCSLYG